MAAPDGSQAALHVIVTARNEADRIGATLDALRSAFPGAALIVGDDASTDATAAIAREHGALVVGQSKRVGKGGAATAAAELVGGSEADDDSMVLLCDGDLGDSARALHVLVDAVRLDEADLAIAAFRHKQGGGFGLAVGYARRAIRRRTGLTLAAPISGQRAMRVTTLRRLLPFAPGFGMEVGMTIDAARAGCRIKEIELDLEHAATRRNLHGFHHRARQLLDFIKAVHAR